MPSENKNIKALLAKNQQKHEQFLEKFKEHRHEILERQKDESILFENKRRFVLFPIKFHEIYDAYKKREALFWTAEETELKKDLIDWEKNLDVEEKDSIKRILAIFATSVLADLKLTETLSAEVQTPEAKCFYGFQIMVDNVHEEVYSLVIDSLVKDEVELDKMFEGIEENESSQEKIDFAQRWFNAESSLFAEKLVAFAAIQGLFSLNYYASIYSLKKRDLLPGITTVNEQMCKDHAMHSDFQFLMFNHLKNKINEDIIERIIIEAAEIEKKELSSNLLNFKNLGLDVKQMKELIEYVADNILDGFGNEKHYKTSNPYDYINKSSFPGDIKSFQKKVNDLRKVKAVEATPDNPNFSFNDDF